MEELRISYALLPQPDDLLASDSIFAVNRQKSCSFSKPNPIDSRDEMQKRPSSNYSQHDESFDQSDIPCGWQFTAGGDARLSDRQNTYRTGSNGRIELSLPGENHVPPF